MIIFNALLTLLRNISSFGDYNIDYNAGNIVPRYIIIIIIVTIVPLQSSGAYVFGANLIINLF